MDGRLAGIQRHKSSYSAASLIRSASVVVDALVLRVLVQREIAFEKVSR